MSSVSDWPTASNTKGFFVKIWRPMLEGNKIPSRQCGTHGLGNLICMCTLYLYWLVSIWTNPSSDFLSSRQRTKSVVDKRQTIVTCVDFVTTRMSGESLIDFDTCTCIDFGENECHIVGQTDLAAPNGLHRCRPALEKSCQRDSFNVISY